MILRLLEQKLSYKYSINSTIESLKNFGCIEEFSNVYMLSNNSEIIEKLNKFYNSNVTKKDLQSL